MLNSYQPSRNVFSATKVVTIILAATALGAKAVTAQPNGINCTMGSGRSACCLPRCGHSRRLLSFGALWA